MPNNKTSGKAGRGGIKSKARSKHQTNAGAKEMNLSGFQPVMWPTVYPAKLVYSDFRALTCSGSQVEYVYRLNSLFDPDFTSVGGQPDGFDQLKQLYNRYRVVAVDVEVEVAGQAAVGFVAIAPSDTPAVFLNAEGVAGLRYAQSGVFTGATPAKLHARYHIGKLLGYSDDSVLGNENLDAAVSGNPAFQQYLLVAIEGGTSASQSQNVWTKITYYARMEVPIAVLDSSVARRLRFQLACSSTATADNVEPAHSKQGEGGSSGGEAPVPTTQPSVHSEFAGTQLPRSAFGAVANCVADTTAVQVVKEVGPALQSAALRGVPSHPRMQAPSMGVDSGAAGRRMPPPPPR